MKSETISNGRRKAVFFASEQRRKELEEDVARYLKNGGQITQLPPAGSARVVTMREIEILKEKFHQEV